MLRDKSLIPLSHQHQHALALCVRINRAQPIPTAELEAWQAEIEQQFEQEINIHFSAEEKILFEEANRFSELVPVVAELVSEHASLRKSFHDAEDRCLSSESLPVFAQRLSAHIRKEERQLFERLQQLMTPQELTGLGTRLESALKDAAKSCALPNQATRLKPKK